MSDLTRWMLTKRSVRIRPRPRDRVATDPAVESRLVIDSEISFASRFLSSKTTVTTSPGRTPSALSPPRRMRKGVCGSSLKGSTRRKFPSSTTICPFIDKMTFSVSKASA